MTERKNANHYINSSIFGPLELIFNLEAVYLTDLKRVISLGRFSGQHDAVSSIQNSVGNIGGFGSKIIVIFLTFIIKTSSLLNLEIKPIYHKWPVTNGLDNAGVNHYVFEFTYEIIGALGKI